MIDKLLAIGSTFDYITPAISLVATSSKDRLVIDGADIQKARFVLGKRGIRCRREQIINGVHVFDVGRGLGKEAEKILKKNRIYLR